MAKKRLFRSVVFVLLTAILLVTLCDLFEIGNNYASKRIETYQHFKKDTVDAVFVGTSGMDRYWISAKGFEEYGLTAYCLSTDAMPSWLIKVMLKEAVRKQSPKLAIIDMRSFLISYPKGTTKFDVQPRRVIDVLDFFSLTRLEAINTTLKIIDAETEDGDRFDPSYYLSFIKYHNQWEEDGFSLDEIKDPKSVHLGFYMHNTLTVSPIAAYSGTVKTQERMPLYPLCEEVLYDLLDYLSEQDYEVLFLDTPHCHNETEAKRMNTMCDILDERGFNYLVCDVEDARYDINDDFYNDGHVNYYGAEKFTQWFAEYLKASYDLPDRRDDEDCAEWYGAYDKIKSDVAKYEERAKEKEE